MEEENCQRRVQGNDARQRLIDVCKLGSDPHLAKHPIGVFDSGIGGLSILQALLAELPHENFVYLSDSGHAPYGERDDAHVLARSRTITRHLLTQHNIKTLVIACNTATAAAIQVLRQQHPDLPFIGVEPALKPAVALSRTRRIGVMATRGTLGSAKFAALLASLPDQINVVCQACDGLADAIERDDTAKIRALCAQYVRAMGPFGTEAGQIDALVLGCTHYTFAYDHLKQLLPGNVDLIDNGASVARQTRRVLPALSAEGGVARCLLLTTGEPATVQRAARRWLSHTWPVQTLLV